MTLLSADIAGCYNCLLVTRKRHSQISTTAATQKYSIVSPIVKVNITELYECNLRGTGIEEDSALLDNQTLLRVCGAGHRGAMLVPLHRPTREDA